MSVAKSQTNEHTFGWIMRRLLLYIGLAFAALTAFALFFALSVWLGIGNKVDALFKGGWIGFLTYTVLLFWITVRESRRRWAHWSFWLTIVGLLTVHCLAFIAIVRLYAGWRVIWFWPITVVEGGIFSAALAWLFPGKHPKAKSEEL